MFLPVHAAAGAIIGTEIINPYWAFVAGVVLHFIMDIIPHGDHALGKKFFGLLNKKISEEEEIKSLATYGMLNSLIVILFIIYAFKNYYFAKDDGVIWAIIGSILPDILVTLYVLTKSRCLKWFFDFHKYIHHLLLEKIGGDIPLKYGIALQTILFILLMFVLQGINLNGPLF